MPVPPRKPNYWFVRKQYGWGWVPATREGWTVMAAHIALIIFWADIVLKNGAHDASSVLWFVAIIILQSIVLIYVCYKTGEPPMWQWGTKLQKR